ncbi:MULTISPECIES: phage tail protein I [unclassified Halomonas]|uniref:phage tail protein I n=1 Tax=unclassified Halomonas TaxID=2609666 RepID=UPI00099057CD|nr:MULTISPECIES: phage tail protein I [unclassified Halomonas]AQU84924.1 phage tail protein I [Halomonas sp. 'Soap Lake \
MANHLLPPNATSQERAISSTLSRTDTISVPIRELWQPHTCPERLLPWLAWALSVDEWDEQWSESQKRNAIDASVYLHRHKGTPVAVQRAVDLIFDDAEVQEWFHYGGQPFHFRIVSDNAFTSEREYHRLIRIIEAAKNARSRLEAIIIRSRVTHELTLATATAQGNRTQLGPSPTTLRNEPSALKAAAAQHCATRVRIAPKQLRLAIQAATTAQATAYHDYRHITIRG